MLHEAGATVVVAARRADRLEALAADLGDRVLAVACDVAVDADCERLVATTVERFGRLDVLVNNAGTSVTMPAEDEPIEDWRRVVDVNLTGLFALTQLAGRQMLAQGAGRSSTSPRSSAWWRRRRSRRLVRATKGAVINLTRELACQWARKGVRVNAIAPGWFLSEMTDDGMFDDEKAMAYLRAQLPDGAGRRTARARWRAAVPRRDASTLRHRRHDPASTAAGRRAAPKRGGAPRRRRRGAVGDDRHGARAAGR